MTDSQQARDTVHGGTKIISVTLVRVAAVKRRANMQAIDTREIFLEQRALSFDGCTDGFRCGSKGGAKCVSDGLEYVAAVRFNCGTHEPIVARDGGLHGLAVGFPTFGAAFDVGEQKRHRAGW